MSSIKKNFIQSTKRVSFLKGFLLIAWLIYIPVSGRAQYHLHILYSGKDSSFDASRFITQTNFRGPLACLEYVRKIPSLLAEKGFPAASVDSSWSIDSTTFILLFTGKKYLWWQLKAFNVDEKAMQSSGFFEDHFNGKPVNISQVKIIQERILSYYEKNGYPFAKVFLDSIRIDNEKIQALITCTPGLLYFIDSIRVSGKAKIANRFLSHYLDIPKHSIYNKEKLQGIGKRLEGLTYIRETQPAQLTMLGTGSILDLYLEPRKSSQVNFLVGLLPSGSQSGKLRITADVHLNLENLLNSGEVFLLNWQSIQEQSPRLKLGYQQPFVFNSPFGMDFLFDMFKKDSSFLQLNTRLGAQFILSSSQSGQVFAQWQNTILQSGGVDTSLVKATRQLPPNIDLNAVNAGIDYNWNRTDYRYNPRSGNEISINILAGIKHIKRNNDILSLKDPLFNYASLYDSIKTSTYQVRLKLSAFHYFPAGSHGTWKTGIHSGIFGSQFVFRNELFQLGGFKLMRGFNEESIYATQYAVGILEYRNLFGLNSYLFGFVDAGWVRNKYQAVDASNTLISAGLGIVYGTRTGLLNISFAIGKRNDVPFNIREAAKIHFGYINYF